MTKKLTPMELVEEYRKENNLHLPNKSKTMLRLASSMTGVLCNMSPKEIEAFEAGATMMTLKKKEH